MQFAVFALTSKEKTNVVSNTVINISHFELFGQVLCLLGGMTEIEFVGFRRDSFLYY
jgi:hypothetical protein